MSDRYAKKNEVSVLNWIGTLILLAIPLVNLIVLVVWAISCKRPSKRNYAIATLVLALILIVVSILAIALFGSQMVEWVEWLDAGGLTGGLPLPIGSAISGATPAPLVEATPAPVLAATPAPVIAP